MSGANKYYAFKGIVLAAGIALFLRLLSRKRHCIGCNPEQPDDDDPNVHMHDVNHPLVNVREAAKQCVLLEDHLFERRKRCSACVKKHFLNIEGLLEEAVSLDQNNAYQFLRPMPDSIRHLIKLFATGAAKPQNIGQGVRCLRQKLVEHAFYIPQRETLTV